MVCSCWLAGWTHWTLGCSHLMRSSSCLLNMIEPIEQVDFYLAVIDYSIFDIEEFGYFWVETENLKLSQDIIAHLSYFLAWSGSTYFCLYRCSSTKAELWTLLMKTCCLKSNQYWAPYFSVHWCFGTMN